MPDFCADQATSWSLSSDVKHSSGAIASLTCDPVGIGGPKPSAHDRRSIEPGTQRDEAIPNCFGQTVECDAPQKPLQEPAVLPKRRVPDVANQDGQQEVPSAMTHRQACAAEPKQKAPVMLLDELAIVDCCVGASLYAP
jgi:hypothetical protein